MERRFLTLLLSLIWLAPALWGQSGFVISSGKSQVEIPFEYENNFIILNLLFNGKLPLRFIFDTGAEHTILTKREVADLIGVTYEREFRIIGSDMKTELVAYLARRMRFEFPDRAIARHEDILVLDDDYFRFEEFAGINVHGILAAGVFSKFIIKINYQRKVIQLFDREAFKMRESGFEAIPLEYYRGKLYLNTFLEVQKDSVAPVKLLIDTGAGLPLLLFTNTHPLLKPPSNALAGNIGMGLGGFLEGFHGRVSHLKLGSFEQRAIVTEFQQLDSAMADRGFLNQRNGLLGNMILSRYVVLLDFQEEKMWLKPTKNAQREFAYDRSGLSLLVSGSNLGQFYVQNVLPNSPAAEADIRKGDRIMRLGLLPVSFMNLPDLLRVLEGKPGKKLKIVVKRDGKRLKKTVVLRDLL